MESFVRDLDELGDRRLSARQEQRLEMLRLQTHRLISFHRKRLWARVRELERRHRERVNKKLVHKYVQWFMETDQDRDRALEEAALRIQAVFRGARTRFTQKVKMVALGRRLRRGVVEEGEETIQDASEQNSIHNNNRRLHDSKTIVVDVGQGIPDAAEAR